MGSVPALWPWLVLKPISLGINTTNCCANSKQDSITTEGCTEPTQGKRHLKCPAQVTREAESLVPTGPSLYKITLPRPGGIAALPNTQKQTQSSSQNQETKKHVPNERTEQNSGAVEEVNKMETSSLPRCRVQNSGCNSAQ